MEGVKREEIIGSIYPAALIGKTPLFGRLYMPYRLIFTTERVIAFYPDAKKTFRSGIKLFKAYEYRSSKWKSMLATVGDDKIICYGSEGVSDEMLETDGKHGYGSLTYDSIGGVLLRGSEDKKEFSILFRPTGEVLVRGLEFYTARSALEGTKKLLEKTALSGRIEAEI